MNTLQNKSFISIHCVLQFMHFAGNLFFHKHLPVALVNFIYVFAKVYYKDNVCKHCVTRSSYFIYLHLLMSLFSLFVHIRTGHFFISLAEIQEQYMIRSHLQILNFVWYLIGMHYIYCVLLLNILNFSVYFFSQSYIC